MLSEIAPAQNVVEVYNPGDLPVNLDDWQLRTANHTAIFTANTTLAPHSFALVALPGLAQSTAVQLTQPNGSVADAVRYSHDLVDVTLSRYPVQGGGWQQGTPSTLGDWNLPASAPSPSPSASPPPTATIVAAPVSAASEASEAATAAPVAPRSGWSPWLLAPLVILALGWAIRRNVTQSSASQARDSPGQPLAMEADMRATTHTLMAGESEPWYDDALLPDDHPVQKFGGNPFHRAAPTATDTPRVTPSS